VPPEADGEQEELKNMKRFLALIGLAALAVLAGADANDLVISEVLEAAPGNLKYVEIHNQGVTPVNLDDAGADIVLRRYTNGTVSVSATLDLTGTVAAGDYYVVANNATDFNTNTFGFDADQYDTIVNHNGNDVYDLFNSTSATVLDGFAADNIGDATSFATDVVAFRIGLALPNNGDWGDATEPPAGSNSASGFWVVETTSNNAQALAQGTPGTAGGSGGDEVPVELIDFSID
jgi:hypothetical protein